MTLDDAKLIIRGRRSASTYEIAEAAVAVLDHAEAVEKMARDYVAAHPYPGRDEFERGSIIAMQLILGVPLGQVL